MGHVLFHAYPQGCDTGSIVEEVASGIQFMHTREVRLQNNINTETRHIQDNIIASHLQNVRFLRKIFSVNGLLGLSWPYPTHLYGLGNSTELNIITTELKVNGFYIDWLNTDELTVEKKCFKTLLKLI